jgi:hypothetical protein
VTGAIVYIGTSDNATMVRGTAQARAASQTSLFVQSICVPHPVLPYMLDGVVRCVTPYGEARHLGVRRKADERHSRSARARSQERRMRAVDMLGAAGPLSNDTFSYPVPPVVYSVSGCPRTEYAAGPTRQHRDLDLKCDTLRVQKQRHARLPDRRRLRKLRCVPRATGPRWWLPLGADRRGVRRGRHPDHPRLRPVLVGGQRALVPAFVSALVHARACAARPPLRSEAKSAPRSATRTTTAGRCTARCPSAPATPRPWWRTSSTSCLAPSGCSRTSDPSKAARRHAAAGCIRCTRDVQGAAAVA